ncbi:tuftelin-like [Scleropages formosus]|uniref:Tuftelin-like n=1 Tax=Scleropages formosus TaxID=113540 RepID=A0A0P7VAG2_SCLFO|nr:tuftelin-like [Scleropages formosus]
MDKYTRLRLTLHDQNQPIWTSEQPRSKPVGRAFALVQPPNERQPFELVKPTEEKVEVIKVYLEGHKEEQAKHQQSLKMLSDEVSQIQEVRYCLKTLREQMAARNNSNNNQAEQKVLTNGYRAHVPKSQWAISKYNDNSATAETQDWEKEDEQESARMREVSKRLYAQLQEAERRHQEEREKLRAESSQFRQQLSEQGERLRQAEQGLEERDQRIEDLQRLLVGMEVESATLQEKMKEREEELLKLRTVQEDGRSDRQRSEELEKELAILKEKIHHLDDMLKSQQRKVRHMIEQLQNSRTVIQERERVIRELEEKVAFLEAENREMHDQVDYFLESQRTNSHLSTERNAQIVYSKPLRPSTNGNKSLPFIKVIEIKS